MKSNWMNTMFALSYMSNQSDRVWCKKLESSDESADQTDHGCRNIDYTIPGLDRVSTVHRSTITEVIFVDDRLLPFFYH